MSPNADIAAKLQAILADLDPIRTTVQQVTEEYRNRQLSKYRHNDGQYNRLSNLCDWLDDEYCDQPADEFGPRRLADLRDQFIRAGLSRRYINDQVANVVRIFRHAVSRELIKAEVVVALETLEPLKRGEAKEPPKRKPVPVADVQATYRHLTGMLQAMVTIQFTTGMRPGELFKLRPDDIDRSGGDWIYRPEKHKTSHHGKAKAIPIVGAAKDALMPYIINREPDELCFITARGNPWNRNSYRTAIQRAASKAGVPKWHPYQLRTAAADAANEKLGIEYARDLLGHSSDRVTKESYARQSEQRLAEQRAVKAARLAPKIC